MNAHTDKKTKDIDELCKILRLLRIAQDLSTKEVADKMHVRTSYITDVERGDRKPSLSTLDKYCEALNVSPNNLFLWREEQKEKNYSYRKLLMKLLLAVEELDECKKKEEQKLYQLKDELSDKKLAN